MKRFLPLAALLAATPVMAQQAPHADPNPGVTAAREVWTQAHNYVTKSAEQMPEEKFSFRPVDSVRTFGELVGHVAGAEMMFCAAALGEKVPGEDAVEKTAKTKADLVAALKKSADYCARAYALTDAGASSPLTIFGMKMSGLGVLTLNAAHDYEHYGNIVTYLRINGMVPPSSQPAR
ncbi:MAG: DinB family protein [Longimicrobiales bacterium]